MSYSVESEEGLAKAGASAIAIMCLINVILISLKERESCPFILAQIELKFLS